jgi:hypothetical protein
MIDRCWEPFPKHARQLLVDSARPVDLHALAEFWSLPLRQDFTRGHVVARTAASLSGTSWRLALTYLELGQVTEARALALNGAFLHQCSVSRLSAGTSSSALPCCF